MSNSSTMLSYPFISIIIPTYRHWDQLKLCLDALSKQSYPVDAFEVVIINNDGESYDVPESLSLAKNMIIIHEPTAGSYAARNAGLDILKGDIVGFTDSDCIPDTDWILNAVKFFESEPNAERVAGKVNLFRLDSGSRIVSYYETITAFNQKYNVKKGLGVTANLFVKSEIFRKVGSFNDKLFSGGDMEWNDRASKQGVAISYVENVQVSHPARATYGELVQKTRRVTGGAYFRRTKTSKERPLLIQTILPPINLIRLLHADGKSLLDITFATVFAMSLRFFAFIELLRIMLGGKPLRK
jgi:GT2 family glycosyltransferase